MPMTPSANRATENIVQRLNHRIEQAKGLGFEIRTEWLDGMESTWCELGGTKILFLDVSKNAVEQLDQVDKAIAWSQQQAVDRAGIPSRRAA